MGYRSEVKIVFTGTDFDVARYQAEWLSIIKDLKIPSDDNWHGAGQPLFDLEDTHDVGVLTVGSGRGEWLFEFESVKWYDDYPTVKEYQALMDNTPSELHCECIRIGEEADDIAHDFYGDNTVDAVFYIARSIERN
jgi:hypothetical protein